MTLYFLSQPMSIKHLGSHTLNNTIVKNKQISYQSLLDFFLKFQCVKVSHNAILGLLGTKGFWSANPKQLIFGHMPLLHVKSNCALHSGLGPPELTECTRPGVGGWVQEFCYFKVAQHILNIIKANSNKLVVNFISYFVQVF